MEKNYSVIAFSKFFRPFGWLVFLFHSSKVVGKEFLSSSEIPLMTTWWRWHCTINTEAAGQCGFPRPLQGPPSLFFLPPLFCCVSPQVLLSIQSSLIHIILAKKLSDRNWILPTWSWFVLCSQTGQILSVPPIWKNAQEHFECCLKLYILSLKYRSFYFALDWPLQVTYSLPNKIANRANYVLISY